MSEIYGSHCGENVDFGIMHRNAFRTCRQIPIFQRNLLLPSSGALNRKGYMLKKTNSKKVGFACKYYTDVKKS